MRFATKSILVLSACIMLAGCGCWPPRWHCDCDERDFIQYQNSTPPMTNGVIPTVPENPGKVTIFQKPDVSIDDTADK
jgi:hypothetical protein